MTLTEDQLTAHSHSYFMVHDNNGPIDTHGTGYVRDTGGVTGITGGSQSHAHDFTGTTAASNNLPMYYALAYIMRIV